MIRFRQMGTECSSKEWISDKQNNGEFDYWLVLRVANLQESCDELPEFAADLSVVAPSEVLESEIEAAIYSTGIDPRHFQSDEMMVEGLHQYGIYAPVWSRCGDDPMQLMVDAVKEAQFVPGMLGIYMDRPVNLLGMTGWEAMRGDHDSVLERLRNRTDRTQDQDLVLRLHQAA